MPYVGKYDSSAKRWKTWIHCQTQENMILTPSAGKHEAYAKRRKINPMPNAGTRILYEARENMNLMRSAGKQMRCQTRENTNLKRSWGKWIRCQTRETRLLFQYAKRAITWIGCQARKSIFHQVKIGRNEYDAKRGKVIQTRKGDQTAKTTL